MIPAVAGARQRVPPRCREFPPSGPLPLRFAVVANRAAEPCFGVDAPGHRRGKRHGAETVPVQSISVDIKPAVR